MGADLTRWTLGSLLFAFRLAPVFAFAPPFSLVRLPRTFRLLLALGLSACLVGYRPEALAGLDFSTGGVVLASARELMLGVTIALAFQIAFGAIYFAGRTVDIQAGLGLALVVDPSGAARAPMVGTLYALLAGLIFFAMNGHHDLLRIIAASLDAVPLGGDGIGGSLAPLLAFLSLTFLTAVGAAGGIVLSLFVADLAIAFLSRTLPQMNVLVLGFQVKTMLLLIALPVTLGLSAALLARLMGMILSALPGLL